MITYAIFDIQSGIVVEVDKAKKHWTKAESIAKANELALKEGKSFEVRQIAIVHTATPAASWDFDI